LFPLIMISTTWCFSSLVLIELAFKKAKNNNTVERLFINFLGL